MGTHFKVLKVFVIKVAVYFKLTDVEDKVSDGVPRSSEDPP